MTPFLSAAGAGVGAEAVRLSPAGHRGGGTHPGHNKGPFAADGRSTVQSATQTGAGTGAGEDYSTRRRNTAAHVFIGRGYSAYATVHEYFIIELLVRHGRSHRKSSEPNTTLIEH